MSFADRPLRKRLLPALPKLNAALRRCKTRLLLAVDGPLLDALSEKTPWADALWRELVPVVSNQQDRSALTVAAYTRTGAFDDTAHLDHEFPWEREAIDRFFPRPPARVLVGAAGAGRELFLLSRRGYDAMGFDPCPAFVPRDRSHREGTSFLGLVRGGYEDLPDGLPVVTASAPYDAAILGWGSLSHLPDEAARIHALHAMRTLCPHGPLLASWLPLASLSREQERLRGLMQRCTGQGTVRESYDRYLGYIRTFTGSELETLARRCGYDLLFADERGATPWAVLQPIKNAYAT